MACKMDGTSLPHEEWGKAGWKAVGDRLPPPSKTPSTSSRSLTKQAYREGAGGLPFLPHMAALALLHILGVAEALYGTQVPTTNDTLGMCRLSPTSHGTLSADPKVGEAMEY